MAKRRRSRREIVLGGAGFLASGTLLAMVLDRITDPALKSVRTPFSVAPVLPEEAEGEPGPRPPVKTSRLAPQPFVMEETLPADVHLPTAPPRSTGELMTPTVRSPQTLSDLIGDVARGEAPPPATSPYARAEKPAATVEAAPLWLRNAQPMARVDGRPMIAIVIDDLGMDRVRTERALALDGGITLAFMAYADGLDRWSEGARAGRHEVLLHVPMEPTAAAVDPGPDALLTTLTPAENVRRLRSGLERITGHIGVNNHMGSRFTESAEALRPVLEEVRRRNLLFLDSRTSPRTQGSRLAGELGLTAAERNVFIDNELTEASIGCQLSALKDVATRRGMAIGIGHPHQVTLTALSRWTAQARADGFVLVPLTSIIRRQAPVHA